MVVTPTVRGLFGLEWDASENKLMVTPNLPAQWNEATISGVPIGQARVGLEMKRIGTTLSVRLAGNEATSVHLESRAPGAKFEKGELRIPLPGVEVGIAHGLPESGARTARMKVINQKELPRSLRLILSAPASSQQTLFLRINESKIHLRADGAEVSGNPAELRIQFPPGSGYVEQTVTLSW